MKILSLACNHCGAPLEVRTGTRFATCRFCGSKLMVHEEGNAAYTEVLERIEQSTGRIEDRLANIELQNEIARVDREWEQERESYYIRGKHGQKHLPTKGGSLVMSVLMAAFGVFWTIMASRAGGPFFIFGVIFIGVAIVSGYYGFLKAGQYESGRSAYEQRRMALLSDDDAQGFWESSVSDS